MPAVIEVFPDLELCPSCGEFKEELSEIEGWCRACCLAPEGKVEVECARCGRPVVVRLSGLTGNPPSTARCGRCKYKSAKATGSRSSLTKAQRKEATRQVAG